MDFENKSDDFKREKQFAFSKKIKIKVDGPWLKIFKRQKIICRYHYHK